MKVLLSAYACAPNVGSEPGVGFETLRAVAGRHEVWLLTRSNNVPDLRAAMEDEGWGESVHLVGMEVPGMRLKKRTGLMGLHWYYERWQARAAGLVGELEDEVGFDLAHHVTFATYWTRTALDNLDVPLVWGPVGGGVTAPWRLLPEVGFRGVVEEGARSLIRPLSATRPAVRRMMRRASYRLVQNDETGERLVGSGNLALLPNATSIMSTTETVGTGRRTSDVITAGRLVPWKATLLALRTMRHVRSPEARLLVYGDGPERERIERAVVRWDLQGRVRLMGQIPRSELLGSVAQAACLLHPALHEESPLTVGEALSLNTPVVGLARGGLVQLLREWPESPAGLVEPDFPETTARALAQQVDRFIGHKADVRGVPREPRRDFGDAILEIYDEVAAR